MTRDYDALLIDVDGTLLTDEGQIHPKTLEALRRIHSSGVRIMIATGRSESAAKPVLAQLDFGGPALVYNGAALYCPQEDRLVEERLLSYRAIAGAIDFAHERDLMALTQAAGAKYALAPRNEHESEAIKYLAGVVIVPTLADLPREFVIRITIFSQTHSCSEALGRDVEREIDHPLLLTHFPLNALARFRSSPLIVADLQPPCHGKAEGLRILKDRFDISSDRVVAIGDASNDVTMIQEAGLGVGMENGMQSLLDEADRVIGSNNSGAIGALLDELF